MNATHPLHDGVQTATPLDGPRLAFERRLAIRRALRCPVGKLPCGRVGPAREDVGLKADPVFQRPPTLADDTLIMRSKPSLIDRDDVIERAAVAALVDM